MSLDELVTFLYRLRDMAAEAYPWSAVAIIFALFIIIYLRAKFGRGEG
jgi:hypothetical protein